MLHLHSWRNRLVLLFLVCEIIGTVLAWRLRPLPLFDALSIWLALSAITFAWNQFFDAQMHSDKMDTICGAMSTKYIGAFPKELDDIIEVVSRADKSLRIVADFTDYGRYSQPEAFERYAAKLMEKLQKRVSVSVLVYSAKLADDALRRQFPKDDFPKMRDSEDGDYRRFFDKYCGIPMPTDYEPFLEVLKQLEQRFTAHIRALGAKVGELTEEACIFFWVEDGESAVFSFQNLGPEGKDVAFQTRESNLIETFRLMFDKPETNTRFTPRPGQENTSIVLRQSSDGDKM